MIFVHLEGQVRFPDAGRKRRQATSTRLRIRAGWAASVIATLGLTTSPAVAYPSSVVFAPSGHVLSETSISAAVFEELPLDGAVMPETFATGQIGVFRGIESGEDRYLSAEAGMDVLSRNQRDVAPTPFVNAKIGIVNERGFRPAIAVGVFQMSSDPLSSADLGYASASMSLGRSGQYGDFSFGGTASFAPSRRISGCHMACAFVAGPPFTGGRWGVLGGWSSPRVGDFAFAVDFVSGTSTASGANAALVYAPFKEWYFATAANFAVDRRAQLNPTDALFLGVGISIEGLIPTSSR